MITSSARSIQQNLHTSEYVGVASTQVLRDAALKAALKILDFNDAKAVKELHEKISNTSVFHTLCDIFIFGGQIKAGQRAFTTLLFYQYAEGRNQSVEHIPQPRDEAMASLLQWLTPVGKTVLLDSVKERLDFLYTRQEDEGNEFTVFLAPYDRFCLAGYVSLAEAETLPNPHRTDAPGQLTDREALIQDAANYFRLAAGYYSQDAKRPDLAITSYEKAGDVYRRFGWLSQVAECKQCVAAVLLKQKRFVEAKEAYRQAAVLYEETAEFYRQCKDTPLAKGFARDAAELHKFADSCGQNQGQLGSAAGGLAPM